LAADQKKIGNKKIVSEASLANLTARGRPKGVPNKATSQVKDMVIQALSEAHADGGIAYLKEQATKNPAAFLTLVGKVIPLQVAGSGNDGEHVHRILLEGVPAK